MSAKNLSALRWPSILPNFAIGSTFVFAHPMCLLVFQSFSGVLQSTQTHVSTNGYLNINLPASCENNACGENMTIVVNLYSGEPFPRFWMEVPCQWSVPIERKCFPRCIHRCHCRNQCVRQPTCLNRTFFVRVVGQAEATTTTNN